MADLIDKLPPEYRTFIDEKCEIELCAGGTLYALEDIGERNATYEVQTYMPDYIAIGDDGGGRAILIRQGFATGVYLLGHGALGSLPPVEIAPDLMIWVSSGCLLPD